MKRIFTIMILLCFSGFIIAQTGIGWAQQRAKVNFKDSTNFVKLPLLNMTDSVSARTYARSVGLYWSGTSTKLVAATGRTSLGGTTVGQAYFTLTNPGAITFPRMNADNTVSSLSAADFKTALTLSSSDVGLGNVTNESKATMFTSPAFTGSVPTATGIPLTRAFTDTMSVSAGVLRTKATTLTTEPYSVQIFTSGGKDITHAVADSVALNGGVYKLYVYSVDAITGAKIKILY